MYNKNVFLRPPEGYVRDLDIIENAVALSADYLHLQTGKPLDECILFVRKQIQTDGQFPLKEINLRGLKRDVNGDRHKTEIPFSKFMNQVLKSEAVLAPNMVVYDSSKSQVSPTAKYLVDKMASRSVVKKKGLTAFQEGDMDTYAFCHNAEGGIKLLSNSTSGAHANKHNPLYSKTAHSSLTSNSRVIVSYSNACTEKLLSGNRHYHSYQVVLENILSITHHTDYDQLETIIARYGLVLPTHEAVMDCINRSTRFYWINKAHTAVIERLVVTLSPLQCAAFLYTGDLYHLAKYNDAVIRTFISQLIEKQTYHYLEDPKAVIKSIDEGIVTFAGILCADILAGNTPAQVEESSLTDYTLYANTIQHVNEVINRYEDFITTFLVTENAPSSIYVFPASIRRCVIGSDTDSTMFTAQDWVEWYYGSLIFGAEADKVSNALCYIDAQVIAHQLAQTSRQMGVVDEHLYSLKMKNEYGFPIYIRANRAKHYATLLASREGNVYKVPKNDIKGVGLKDSKNPKLIMAPLDKEINYVMLNLLEGEGLDIHPLMQRIANLEHLIFESLEKGEIKYLSSMNIDVASTYKKPMSSKYMHYDLWVNVFQHKFGEIDKPPYRAFKVPVILDTPKKMSNWLNSLDPIMSLAFRDWLAKLTKVKMGQLLLPIELFSNGMPDEFKRITDKRAAVTELMAGYYILLEMLGMFFSRKDKLYLLSDSIIYRPEAGLPGDLLKKK